MKNKANRLIALCIAGVFILSSGGAALASETDSVNTDKLGIAEESIAVDESAPATVEESNAQEVIIEEPDKLDWSMEQIEVLSGVLTGVEGKDYDTGTAHKYNIHNSVTYDKDIVAGVLFSTADIDFNTSGEYGMTYYVYFNREALLNYMNENGIDAGSFPGLTEANTNRVKVSVGGNVLVGEAEAAESSDDESYIEEEVTYEETSEEEDTSEETYTEETYYEEPSYEEPAYEEPSNDESSDTGSSSGGTFIATIYDCDGSGHGYTGVFDEVTGDCIEVLDEW